MTKRIVSLLLALTLLAGLLAGCGQTAADDEAFGEGLLFQKTASDEEAFGEAEQEPVYVDQAPDLEGELVLEDEAVPLAAAPAEALLLP